MRLKNALPKVEVTCRRRWTLRYCQGQGVCRRVLHRREANLTVEDVVDQRRQWQDCLTSGRITTRDGNLGGSSFATASSLTPASGSQVSQHPLSSPRRLSYRESFANSLARFDHDAVVASFISRKSHNTPSSFSVVHPKKIKDHNKNDDSENFDDSSSSPFCCSNPQCASV
ncbi:hypothetical protein PIB30_028070 [Stylosanthes scabra]|uniref:Uncharacterized protein n=1 Tax=Stylosanthes scabra TaxID=79078 RepID=A0ABU6RB61_9FABA|nr:hypothetical protein [Stylosanthes scabra]